ncbi:lantibiotic dehydratase C-terminal domain-containing protein [Streptomyces sp. SAI-229]|uniref:lantibiotic dehydratase C-terminal domain-containing protein n=1 Tax=Streptomyces sp. SAI-229 TaxID=3377731 RepID=UPI003C798E12
MSPHNWLFCRLSGAEVSELPELIRSLHAPGDIWFFDPVADPHHPGLGLWFHAVPERLGGIRTALRADGTVRIAEERITERLPRHPGARGIDLADELAAVSSELAVALTAVGALRPENRLAWAVRHLRHLVALVPQRERRAFLFLCWQHWTMALEPAHRIDLGVRAETEAEAMTRETTGPATGPWGRYTDATRAITAAPGFTADTPANFLLFEHAHRTHRRLAVPLAAEALAARIVRAELDATGAAAPALQKA